jgi:hypothetical protein
MATFLLEGDETASQRAIALLIMPFNKGTEYRPMIQYESSPECLAAHTLSVSLTVVFNPPTTNTLNTQQSQSYSQEDKPHPLNLHKSESKIGALMQRGEKQQQAYLAAHLPAHYPLCLVSPIFHREGFANIISRVTCSLSSANLSTLLDEIFATVLALATVEDDTAGFIVVIVGVEILIFERSWLQARKGLITRQNSISCQVERHMQSSDSDPNLESQTGTTRKKSVKGHF